MASDKQLVSFHLDGFAPSEASRDSRRFLDTQFALLQTMTPNMPLEFWECIAKLIEGSFIRGQCETLETVTTKLTHVITEATIAAIGEVDTAIDVADSAPNN